MLEDKSRKYILEGKYTNLRIFTRNSYDLAFSQMNMIISKYQTILTDFKLCLRNALSSLLHSKFISSQKKK